MARPEFKGKRGRLVLRVEKAKDGYGPKNAVADYVCAETLKNGSSAAGGDFGLKF